MDREQILRGIDHWFQRRLTPPEERDRLERDLIDQDVVQTARWYRGVIERNRAEDSRESEQSKAPKKPL